MKEKDICEKCGAEMYDIQTSYTLGMKCPNCGWGWVTQYNEPIVEDRNKYRVILDSKDGSLANVKLVASIVNCNYLRAWRSGLSRIFLINANANENPLLGLRLSVRKGLPHSFEGAAKNGRQN